MGETSGSSVPDKDELVQELAARLGRYSSEAREWLGNLVTDALSRDTVEEAEEILKEEK